MRYCISPEVFRYAHFSIMESFHNPKYGAIARLRERLTGFPTLAEASDKRWFVAVDRKREVLLACHHLNEGYAEFVNLVIKPEARTEGKCAEVLEKVHRACDWCLDGGGKIGLFATIRTHEDLPNEAFTSRAFWTSNKDLPLGRANSRRDDAWVKYLLRRGWKYAFPNDPDENIRKYKLWREKRK